MGADNHPTVRPEQERRDEIHVVLTGSDLHGSPIEDTVETHVVGMLENALDDADLSDEIDVHVERDREDQS